MGAGGDLGVQARVHPCSEQARERLSPVSSAEHTGLLCPARDTGAEDRIDVSLASFSM